VAYLTLTGPISLPGTKGIVLPTAGVHTVGANSGVSFVNNGRMFLALYVPGGYSGNLVQNIGRRVEGQTPAPVTVALTASTNYLFGPWSPSDFTSLDGTGNVYFDLSGTNTSVTVTLYELDPVA
jgi:hypothetical protein